MSHSGGEYYAQQGQGSYPPQQGHAPPPPQGYYPPEQQYQQPYPQQQYSQPPAPYSQQAQPPPYNEPYQQGQHPGQPVGENASYYNDIPASQQGAAPGAEGEKGLGSTIVGGAAGGIVSHQMGAGKLGTAGGATLGAVAMNMATHAL
ncbi:uncharacterized protein N7459_008541 [Penicillium hispanicum]|uniref:uncharacterized protein n=1 Tax=Penicillium hispanicum TaxID=1080232 RepID=UPI002541501D|nr:uncharacterized protein N7459_008541 [Penicillium hispanicum]KAJ5574114.1 hypothetical protein N7459_008541 [Penicillium hispanicum]